MKISIAIPNFNGEKLLAKNLPNILESGTDEVVVLDDGSTDKSLQLLSEFKIRAASADKNLKLKIIEHKKNKGFIPSVNELFEEVTGDVVVLLNNDVWVEKDFLKPILPHFGNPKVFAVNLHEEGEGPAIGFWNNGFFEYKRGEEKTKVQKSAWASGGSATFRKSIWRKLGGFDAIFAPFYFEDTDISFRAIKAGYEVLWEPRSKAKHEHETTIKKTFSRRYVDLVQQRNQLLFIWKNIKDKDLVKEHKRALVKKLLSFKVGYWVPFLWAFMKKIATSPSTNAQGPRNDVRSDLETINYSNSPRLSVIVVSYNSESFIEKCISSVLKFLPESGEVTIFDNGSSDGTVKILEKFGNKIKLIRSSDNLGFAKGNNRAAEEALGDYLFFLNPDTEIKEPIFEELIKFYSETPDAGVVGPRFVMENGQNQESVRELPSVWGAFQEFVLGVKNAYNQYVPDLKEPTEVGVVYGAAMLLSREIFEKLNGFDEKFFLYYEDADLCKRVRALGRKIYYYPKVSIKHLVGATRSDQDRYKLNLESSQRYHGLIGAFLLQIIFLMSRLLKKP